MSAVPVRHRRLGAALLATLALALTSTACGGGTEPAAAPGAGRTVTDVTGTAVTVPISPQRVVALSEQDLDGALALGITPVGTVNGRGQSTAPKYLGDRVTGIAVVGDVAKPTMDKLVAAAPDLILAGSVTDTQILTDLRKLAPTVVTYRPEDDWKTAFRTLAGALGKTDAATTWLAEYDKKAAAAKSRFGADAGAEVSIVRWNPQGPGVMQTGHFASLVAADLGLKRPAGQQEPGFAHSAPLSLENLAKADGDWLFLGTLNADGQKALVAAQASAAYAQLGAVRNKKVVAVDGTVWTSRGGPAAALLVIADISKALGAA
nr:iron-siderophore ABC transporter substrate-binding protein [uncultured bacterium]